MLNELWWLVVMEKEMHVFNTIARKNPHWEGLVENTLL